MPQRPHALHRPPQIGASVMYAELAEIINYLENHHPATVQECNGREIGMLYLGKVVDTDEQIHFAERQIEDRIRRLEHYKGRIESIRRQRRSETPR